MQNLITSVLIRPIWDISFFLSTAPRPYGRHYLVMFETYLLNFGIRVLEGVGKQFS